MRKLPEVYGSSGFAGESSARGRDALPRFQADQQVGHRIHGKEDAVPSARHSREEGSRGGCPVAVGAVAGGGIFVKR